MTDPKPPSSLPTANEYVGLGCRTGDTEEEEEDGDGACWRWDRLVL